MKKEVKSEVVRLIGLGIVCVFLASIVLADAIDNQTVNHILVSSLEDNSTTITTKRGPVVANEPVSWELIVDQENVTHNVTYETPPVYATSLLNLSPKGWIKEIELFTTFSGTYEDVTWTEEVPSTTNLEILPPFKIVKTGQKFVQFIINEIKEQLSFTIKGAFNTTQNITESEEEIIQLPAEIGKPVKWVKKIDVKRFRENITTYLPGEAKNITVYTKNKKELSKYGKEVVIKHKKRELGLEEYEWLTAAEAIQKRVEALIAENGSEESYQELVRLQEAYEKVTKNLGTEKKGQGVYQEISGVADLLLSPEEEVPLEVVITDQSSEFEIVYETEAPRVEEKELSAKKKRVKVISSTHYENVLAWTNISEDHNGEVTVFWVQNDSRTIIRNVTYVDTDNNNLTDQVRWIAPHLSNQTFDIELNILTLQSFPTVGGLWTVEIETSGAANLTIRGVNGTILNNISSDDLQFMSMRCGESQLNHTFVNNTVRIEDYNCNTTGFETSKVLTRGKHKLEFKFGNLTGYAQNFATDNAANLSQIYHTLTDKDIGDTSSTFHLINFTNTSFFDSGFEHDPANVSRLYVNETDTYKIQYGCGFRQTNGGSNGGNHRVQIESWVSANDQEITPSRTMCWTRNNLTDSDRCSTGGSFVTNLNDGDFLNLKVEMAEREGSLATINVSDDCWLNAQRVRLPTIQVVDSNGGDTFSEVTELSISVDNVTFADTTVFGSDTSVGRINVSEDGWYKISYHSCIDNGPQGTRNNPQLWLRRNSEKLHPSEVLTYLRNNGAADTNCLQGTGIYELSTGDYIDMRIVKNVTESASGSSTTLAGASWILAEKMPSNNVLMIYDAAGGQAITSGSTASINFDTDSRIGESFDHESDATQISINKSGFYEVSYTFSWDDLVAGGRHAVCAFARLNGITTVVPSEQCDYSRGDAQARYGSINGNFIINVSEDDFLELRATAQGGTINTYPNGVFMSIIPLRMNNSDSPYFTNEAVNESLLGLNDVSRFNLTVTDIENTTFVNGTIANVNYSFTRDANDEWYYDWTCTSSETDANLTYVISTDKGVPERTNETLINAVGLECDATGPTILNASINASSVADFNATVKVNASVTDIETNLLSVILEVHPPSGANYNLTLSQSGDEFFNDSLQVDKGGRWAFTFYANDTAGNNATPKNATDGVGNMYLEVSSAGDTDLPFFNNSQVNLTLLRFNQTARFGIDVLDSSSGIDYVNGTIFNETFDFTQGSGNEWHYDWTCMNSNASINFSYAGANDTAGNFNETVITGVNLECDATPPRSLNTSINATSETSLFTIARINASIVDTENNIDSVILQIENPKQQPFNTTPAQNGDEFFNDSMNLNESGRWIFTFFFNDTAGNKGNSTLARDQIGNAYIDVGDPFSPSVSVQNPVGAINVNVSENITLEATVTDNAGLSGVIANITYPNGTIVQVTLENSSASLYNYTFKPLLEGQHNITFIATDVFGNENATETVSVTSFDIAEDVSIIPLTTTSYAVAWADLNRVLVEVRHTNGTILANRKVVDDAGGDFSRVSVAAIDSTNFIVGWIDGINDDFSVVKYDELLNVLAGPTDVDTNMGSADDYDVDIKIMSDTEAIFCRADDQTNDHECSSWNHFTWLSSGSVYDLEVNQGTDESRQNYISVAVLNETRAYHVWFDDAGTGGGGPNTSYAYSDGSSALITQQTLNVTDGFSTKVDTVGLRDMIAASVYFLDISNDIAIDVVNLTNDARNPILTYSAIDTAAGTSGGVSIAEITSGVSSNFVVAWHDANAGNIQAAVYDTLGNELTAPFVITNQPSNTLQLIDVTSSVSLRDVRLCEDTFVIGYTNVSEELALNTFNSDGSPWNGTCMDNNPPIVTLEDPSNLQVNDTLPRINMTFNCSAVDGVSLNNISLYLTDALNTTFAENQTASLSGTSDHHNWTVELLAGNYTWNCLAYDTSSNNAWATLNHTLFVNYSNRPPFWSLNESDIQTVYNDSLLSFFNITWEDDFGISNVFFESNYSGVEQNYSMNAILGNVYNYSIILPAGNFYWQSHANDTSDMRNETHKWNFTVAQRTTVLTLESNATFTILNETNTNVSCFADNSIVNVSLYRNDTFLDSSIGGIIVDLNTFNVGDYGYVCNTTGNQNYSAASEAQTLEVTVKNLSTCSLSFDPTPSSVFNIPLNVSCNCSNPQADYELYRNDTNVTLEIDTNVSLAAGDYAYVCNVSSTLGYTGAENSTTFTVEQAVPILNLTINSSNLNVSHNVTFDANLTCLLTEPIGNVTLLQDAVEINENITYVNNITTFLAPSNYEISCQYSGNQNYTSLTSTLFVNATDFIPPNLSGIVPVAASAFEVSQTIEIAANVDDNYLVDAALANITYPNGSNEVFSLANTSNKFNTSLQLLLNGSYSVTFIANDTMGNLNNTLTTTFSASDIGEDITLTPIDNETYALAWVNTREILLERRKTNGSVNISRVVVDTGGSDFARVDVEAVNDTHLLVGWIDGVEDSVQIALYDENLRQVQGPTELTSDVGATDRQDISVTSLSETLGGIGWSDDAENDYEFILWNLESWISGGSQYDVDANIGPDLSRQELVSNVGLNETRVAHMWFDEGGGFNIMRELSTGSSAIIDDTPLNTSDGAASKVASAGLGGMKVAYGYFLDLTNDIVIAIDDFTDDTLNRVVNATVIDTEAGTSGGISVAQIQQGSQSRFVVAWHDANAANIQAAVYSDTGYELTAPFVVSSQPHATYRLIDVAASRSLTGNSFCDGAFVIGYTDVNADLHTVGYRMNGSVWDGQCTGDLPTYFVSQPPANTKFVRADDTNVDVTQTAQSGIVEVLTGTETGFGNYSALLTIDFGNNVDTAGLQVINNRTTAKSVIHNTTNVTFIRNVSLLVPRIKNTGDVYICPGASALSEVNVNCNNAVRISVGENVGGREVSEVTYDSENYYLVTNIQGTGGGENNPPSLTNGNVTPQNGTTNTIFSYNVTYTDEENDNASYVFVNIDGINYTMSEFNISDTNNTDGKLFNFSTNLTVGIHNFTFLAADSRNVTNVSETFIGPNVTADIDLVLVNISFGQESAIETENVSVFVYINNSGGDIAENFTVELNISLFNGTFIVNESVSELVSSLSEGSTTQLNFSWIAKPGTFEFLANVDSLNNESEVNETNNIQFVNYTISSWHLFYGNYLNNSMKLTDGSGNLFYEWNHSNISGSIFFSDTDASFSLANLLPLNDTNDLDEADTALEITHFNDSISSLWDPGGDGDADLFSSIIIEDVLIEEIPVVVTQTSGAFTTGILWDSADGGTQYDGSQDLVFVSEINYSQAGSFGTYDYEIRVPTKLKKITGSIETLTRRDELD